MTEKPSNLDSNRNSCLNIVYLISQDLGSPAGLGRYGPLARELVKLGHKVDIIGLHPGFDELKNTSFIEDGVGVQYVGPMHVMKKGDLKSYYSNSQLIKVTFKATWGLSQSAYHTKADIVHVGKPHPMNSIAGLSAKILYQSMLFIDCDDFEAASGRFNSNWQKNIVALFEKRMPHQATAVTTNTAFMRDKLTSWGVPNEKIIYLPNGVDTARITTPDPESINSLRKELGLEEKKVVAFIGSISLPSHPVNLLLEAFQKVHAIESNTRLIFVGGGEDVKTLMKLSQEMGISDEVIFCGRVPRHKIPYYYAMADVTVDPVYDDDAARGRQPLKIFESWYHGVPLVSGDVGDRKHLLGDPPAGILTEPGDPQSLAMAIQSIIVDPGLTRELRNLGLERVKLYTWDVIASKLNIQYLEFASRIPR